MLAHLLSLVYPEFIPGCTYTALLPGNVSSLALEFTPENYPLDLLQGAGALLTSSFEIPCSIFDIHSMSILCLESRVLISVKIGKNSARNQSKALIPKHKN